MRKIIASLFLVGLALLSAVSLGICQTPPGSKPLSFYLSEAQKIKVGQTTEREVIALLGNPAKRETYKRSSTWWEDYLFYGPTLRGLPKLVGVHLDHISYPGRHRHAVVVVIRNKPPWLSPPGTKQVIHLLIRFPDPY